MKDYIRDNPGLTAVLGMCLFVLLSFLGAQVFQSYQEVPSKYIPKTDFDLLCDRVRIIEREYIGKQEFLQFKAEIVSSLQNIESKLDKRDAEIRAILWEFNRYLREKPK